MALIDYDNDILSKIESSEYLIPSYEEDIRELISQIAAAKDAKLKAELSKQLSQIKKSLETERANLNEYKKARKDISNHIITSNRNARDKKEKVSSVIDKLKINIKKNERLLEASDLDASKQQELIKILENQKKALKKQEVNLAYADDNVRRSYTKIQIAANLRDGWASFLKTGGIIWKDYVTSLKFASFRADNSKLEYSKIIAAETFRFIGTYATTAIKTFYKSSEEVFKRSVNSWGESLRDAISPIFKPFMFIIGGFGLLIKGFSNITRFFFEKKGNKIENEELKREADNPILKYTRWLPDMAASLDDILLNIGLGLEHQRMSEVNRRKYEETQLAAARRKELADKRIINTEKPKKDGLGLMTLFGLGAFAVAYITTRIKTLIISLKTLALPFKVLGSTISWLSGPGGILTKGVGTVGKIFGSIGKAFGFIGKLFSPIASFFSKAMILTRFTAPFMKFIPIIGQIAAIGMALWDFVKGWNKMEGNIFEKFLSGIWAVIEGILEWPMSLLDKLLDLFNMKPEGGVLQMLKKAFNWIFGFGWLKDLIKLLPEWILPDSLKQWANVPSEKTTDDGLNAAIANKNDSQKEARKIEESRKAQAQEKLISELTKGYTNANSSSSSAVAVGGNTTNNTGTRPNENKIRDRVSPELAWAAFAATR